MPSVRSLSSRSVLRNVRREKRLLHNVSCSPSANGHSQAHQYWMVVTLLAFPLVMAFASSLGLGPLLSFLAGAIGSLLVLLVNILLEQEFWMLHSHWRERFEDPDFSHRLLIVSGALLLMLETSFFVLALVDQPFAARVIRLLLLAQA